MAPTERPSVGVELTAKVDPSRASTPKVQVSTTNIDALRFDSGWVSERVSATVTDVRAEVTLKNGAQQLSRIRLGRM
jgi:hypothetical protein